MLKESSIIWKRVRKAEGYNDGGIIDGEDDDDDKNK
jgi:hypothetical protein